MQEQCPVSCKEDDCKDLHVRCPAWSQIKDNCVDNPDMRKYCGKSCNACEEQAAANATGSDEDDEDVMPCVDEHTNCRYWADKGMNENCARSCTACEKIKQRKTKEYPASTEELAVDTDVILEESASFGEKQVADGGERRQTIARVKATIDYMASEKFTKLSPAIKESCMNRNELCAFWAILGECEKNEAYMVIQCAPSCYSCHLIDISARCPVDADAVPGLEPGTLNKMFERIVETAPGNRTLTDEEREELKQNEMTEYTVEVISRPSDEPSTEVSAKNDKLPPWVVVFENFISDEECDEMIQLGYKHEYKRSADVGKLKFDGTHESIENSRRTSENAWCSGHLGCRNATVPTRLHNRMSKVLDIPADNGEDMQILKYEKGQFYRTHHDFIEHQVDRPCGPRILTFFLYLSDVEEGGGTNFPDLGITVEPKKGRALLWPSVYDSNPKKDDPRMRHQALPVKEGTKFAANSWIHLYDYQAAQKKGCH
ncbi:unnamed protein product [Cylindrotheca closterium]|uniref:Procollagen-proline 4-dioxygenase n=1 Tax=Cylindrotheca closterium TaxID=2856 RepID=A0AAD2FP60_9STRA|nr:unnamed protein product [Cylindrotheca closterium]